MENIMKRAFLGSTVAICLAITLSAVSNAQDSNPSLGDYARSVRQNKPQTTKAAAKVYDNDTISSANTISVVGPGPSANATKKSDEDKNSDKATSAESKSGDQQADDKPPAVKPGQSLEERQKVFDEWKTRIADEKKKIDQMAHDLNDYQHNSTLAQVSVWPENQKYAQGLSEKQKSLDQAKTELNNLQEQARKAGVPSSVIE
jgi:hypothetical protein